MKFALSFQKGKMVVHELNVMILMSIYITFLKRNQVFFDDGNV